jgi:hypothetical protein
MLEVLLLLVMVPVAALTEAVVMLPLPLLELALMPLTAEMAL